MVTNKFFAEEEKFKIIGYANEHGRKAAASKFGVSERTIFRWERLLRDGLSLKNKSSRANSPHPKQHTEQEVENIKKVMEENPGIGIRELYKTLVADYGYTKSEGGLHNFLKRKEFLPKTKNKNDYATMFDQEAVKRFNTEFIFKNKAALPLYLIEVDSKGIYIERNTGNNPCGLTVYYSTALHFTSKEEARDFVKKISNTSELKIKIKELR